MAPKPKADKPAPKAKPKRPPRSKATAKEEAPAPVVLDPKLSAEDELVSGMDPQHVQFVDEYLRTYNQTKAYMAVYNVQSAGGACASAHRLLNSAKVRALMALRIKVLFEKSEDLQTRVLEQLVAVAFADPNELMEMRRECCRFCYGEDHLYQYKPGEWRNRQRKWEEDLRKALERNSDASDADLPPEPDPEGGTGYDPRKEPVESCPECYGEGIEREVFKDTRNLSPSAQALYAGVKRTKEGLELLVHNQERARETLMKILRLYDERQETVVNLVSAAELDALYERSMKQAEANRAKFTGTGAPRRNL